MNPLRHRTLTRRERFASSLNLFSITMISNFILYGMMTQLPDFELEAGRFMFSTNEVGVGKWFYIENQIKYWKMLDTVNM